MIFKTHLIRYAQTAALAAVVGLQAVAASALQYSCEADAMTVAVDVNPSAGTCAVDGRRAALRKPHNPVVCHVSSPQLRIVTIGNDGSFIWEDTSQHIVLRGSCIRS